MSINFLKKIILFLHKDCKTSSERKKSREALIPRMKVYEPEFSTTNLLCCFTEKASEQLEINALSRKYLQFGNSQSQEL